jgi:hypothetical protein
MLHRRGIKLLKIEIGNLHIKTVKVDATIDDSVKHKGIVRAWRYSQAESIISHLQAF